MLQPGCWYLSVFFLHADQIYIYTYILESNAYHTRAHVLCVGTAELHSWLFVRRFVVVLTCRAFIVCCYCYNRSITEILVESMHVGKVNHRQRSKQMYAGSKSRRYSL